MQNLEPHHTPTKSEFLGVELWYLHCSREKMATNSLTFLPSIGGVCVSLPWNWPMLALNNEVMLCQFKVWSLKRLHSLCLYSCVEAWYHVRSQITLNLPCCEEAKAGMKRGHMKKRESERGGCCPPPRCFSHPSINMWMKMPSWTFQSHSMPAHLTLAQASSDLHNTILLDHHPDEMIPATVRRNAENRASWKQLRPL